MRHRQRLFEECRAAWLVLNTVVELEVLAVEVWRPQERQLLDEPVLLGGSLQLPELVPLLFDVIEREPFVTVLGTAWTQRCGDGFSFQCRSLLLQHRGRRMKLQRM